ncbi:hypothetical protein Nepgr_032621 [Nepenthes gracilis]|uniref:Uncharacterized protein n=1 Tax=Nepenthes gracilis TaxID=150966 RepID=A0AAD3Y672_NEPGR|nr:hypothetical protein Nepgr_032621 [Nepenthes gracilis]
MVCLDCAEVSGRLASCPPPGVWTIDGWLRWGWDSSCPTVSTRLSSSDLDLLLAVQVQWDLGLFSLAQVLRRVNSPSSRFGVAGAHAVGCRLVALAEVLLKLMCGVESRLVDMLQELLALTKSGTARVCWQPEVAARGSGKPKLLSLLCSTEFSKEPEGNQLPVTATLGFGCQNLLLLVCTHKLNDAAAVGHVLKQQDAGQLCFVCRNQSSSWNYEEDLSYGC